MRFAGVLLAAGLGIAAVAHAADPVTATLTVDPSSAVVEMTIASGWHVNAHEPRDRFLIPTTVTLAPPTGMTAAAVQYPTPVEKALAFAEGKRLLLYEGTVR